MPYTLSPADLAHLGGTVGEVLSGVTVTPETVEQVAEALVEADVDVDALARRLLADEERTAYDAAAVVAGAWAAYRAVVAGAWAAYRAIVAGAWAACEAAIGEVAAAYDSAEAEAWATHRAARARALCRLLAERT